MIITRTPMRVSFFGGGTDHPTWYKSGEKGAVLSTTIDKYVYTFLRPLPAIFDFNYRVAWRILEQVNTVGEIQNPVVREILKNYAPQNGVGYEIAYNADLPARTGLGSSSSFAVSGLHALHTHLGHNVSKEYLAQQAIKIEQEFLQEPVGSQDQTAAAYGGLNQIDFYADGKIVVDPIDISPRRLRAFEDHIYMYFTRFTRDAGAIEKKKIENFDAKRDQLRQMYSMVATGREILEDRNASFAEFGKLLDSAWHAKRSLSTSVSNGTIDDLYEVATKAGAYGGKLLGAGGGGFILFFVPPDKHEQVRHALTSFEIGPDKHSVYIPTSFDNTGSQVILHQPELNKNYQWPAE